MAESTGSRPPVAIRIVRPYQTEDEFLENELETVGKTSVILIGAHARPTGVILRFEVTLATGATVLRGEGRVLAHKESAFRGQPGLSLRFTRLDPKSKALVDRAAAIREAKAAGDPAPMSARPSSPPGPGAQAAPPPSSSRAASGRPPAASQPDASIADALTAETPPPPSRASRAPRGRSSPPASSRPASLPPQPPAVLRRSEPPRVAEAAPASSEPLAAASAPPPAPSVEPAPDAASPAAAMAAAGQARAVARPADRDGLLARLRERAAALPAERVAQILAPRG